MERDDRRIERDREDSKGVRCPELDLEYLVWGVSPIQGIGTVRGREFYFRARGDAWEFEISEVGHGVRQDALPREFLRAGKHTGATMTLADAASLVEKCAVQFLGRDRRS